MNQDLDVLIEEMRKGKDDTFERLLGLLQNTVYSFGMKVCGQVEDAQDTMQETLLKAFQSLPGLEFQNARALKVWLYKVAKNACLMKRRKGKFEPKMTLSLDEFVPAAGDARPEIPDWSGVPLDQVLQTELGKLIQQAIRKLPERYRVVVVLRDMEQLSTAEASDVLGISQETVKVRLHRSRLFLRRELEHYFLKTKGVRA
jgi:RNA polymerase sigma-70 factor (ECF subfamily)